MKNTKININSVKLANNCFASSTSSMNNLATATNLLVKDTNKNISRPCQKNLKTAFVQNPISNNPLTVLPIDNNSNSTTRSTGLQLLDNLAKPTSKWSGLVFLKKKGRSQTKPNFNFINYNFPYGAYINEKEELITPNYNVNKILVENIYKLLVIFFKSMYCLISKPVFIFTQDTIKIQLFYFACLSNHLSFEYNYIFSDFFFKKVYSNKFKLICGILSKFFNKPVELELIRLHKPYLDSNILVNFLSLIVNRRDLTKSINKVFTSRSMNILLRSNAPTANSKVIKVEDIKYLINNLKNLIKQENSNRHSINLIKPVNSKENLTKPVNSMELVNNWFGLSDNTTNYNINPITEAYLTGINIKISGRLRREPIIPKVTTKKFEKGFTAKGKINYSQMARFTHRNRKGAFSITIKSGQNF